MRTYTHVREREHYWTLVHSSNDKARLALKPGSRNKIWLSYMGGKNSVT